MSLIYVTIYMLNSFLMKFVILCHKTGVNAIKLRLWKITIELLIIQSIESKKASKIQSSYKKLLSRTDTLELINLFLQTIKWIIFAIIVIIVKIIFVTEYKRL